MRLVRVAAAVAVGVAVLAGCSDGETANETLPSTSSTPTETTASLPPLGPPDLPMPAEAREQTPAGAEAFLRYYMAVYTMAQATMNSGYMDEFSQGCDLCDALTTNIRNDAASGYTYEGGNATVKNASFGEVEQGKIESSFSMDQAALVVNGPDGATLPDLSAPSATLDCGAIFNWSQKDTSWIFAQWDVN